MSFITNCVVGLIAAQTAFAKPCDYTQHGLTWTKNGLRMNQIQVVGTHNSYHIEAPLEEQKVQQTLLENTINYWYSHPALGIQLTDLHVRNLELDVFADPEGGNYARPLIRNLSGLEYPDDPALEEPRTKVLHVADADVHTQCVTFIDCLKEIKSWMDKHPKSVPIPIMVEFKVADQKIEENGGAKVIPWDNEELLEGLDEEIRSVFSKEQLITPDHIRRPNMTLEDSVLKFGWPDLESARGRIFFLMDNGPEHVVRYQYLEDRPNLEGRVLFTNAAPGDDDCAFQKLNDPTSEEQLAQIQDAVSSNYWVRTRSDVPLDTVLNCSTEMREQAFRSGAQIVSTDFPEYGPSSRWSCDFAVKLEGGRAARCNPVNAPAGCEDDTLEKPEYVKD